MSHSCARWADDAHGARCVAVLLRTLDAHADALCVAVLFVILCDCIDDEAHDARLVAVLFKACRAEDAHDAFCVTAPVCFMPCRRQIMIMIFAVWRYSYARRADDDDEAVRGCFERPTAINDDADACLVATRGLFPPDRRS